MPKIWVLKPQDFVFDLEEFNGENVEWSWLYNCSKVELWYENQNGAWIQSPHHITYAANELYLNHGLKRFFYQSLGWHWDVAGKQLRRGNQPSYYNPTRLPSVSEHDLLVDTNKMPMARDLETKLTYEVGYHINKL